MIRGIALTASVLLAGAVPALAQSHSPPHASHHPHGPGHVRPDSARHATLHARLQGSWNGTFSSQGHLSGLDLAASYDSARKVTLQVSPDQPIRAGAASNFVMDRATLRWTQDWSGAACQARAVRTPATPLVPETMEGTLACEHGEMTFILRKKTG